MQLLWRIRRWCSGRIRRRRRDKTGRFQDTYQVDELTLRDQHEDTLLGTFKNSGIVCAAEQDQDPLSEPPNLSV